MIFCLPFVIVTSSRFLGITNLVLWPCNSMKSRYLRERKWQESWTKKFRLNKSTDFRLLFTSAFCPKASEDPLNGSLLARNGFIRSSHGASPADLVTLGRFDPLTFPSILRGHCQRNIMTSLPNFMSKTLPGKLHGDMATGSEKIFKTRKRKAFQ